jgi:hypothetical protein
MGAVFMSGSYLEMTWQALASRSQCWILWVDVMNSNLGGLFCCDSPVVHCAGSYTPMDGGTVWKSSRTAVYRVQTLPGLDNKGRRACSGTFEVTTCLHTLGSRVNKRRPFQIDVVNTRAVTTGSGL